MWPSDEENLSNMDGWKIYAYLQTKTIFIVNQILDFFPALLDSPSWIILLATIFVVLPLIWLLVKLIQWIRQPLDSIQAVKVCLNFYLLLFIPFEYVLCNNWYHFTSKLVFSQADSFWSVYLYIYHFISIRWYQDSIWWI